MESTVEEPAAFSVSLSEVPVAPAIDADSAAGSSPDEPAAAELRLTTQRSKLPNDEKPAQDPARNSFVCGVCGRKESAVWRRDKLSDGEICNGCFLARKESEQGER